jgi:cytidine deaminase
MGLTIDWEALFAAADAARKRAYARYSNFHVGAAILCDDASIIGGCNVENASYGLTICAERSAISRMVYEGKKLIAVAIVVDSQRPTPPCGMCRQVMAEFGPATSEVRSRNLKGSEAKYTLAELLPHAFTPDFL